MTLGPKFFCCSKMAVSRRRSKLWWRKAHQSKALVELQRSRRSKRDLKPSGIQSYTVFNDFHVKKMSFSKKCRKSILTGVEIRKKLRWIQWWYPFWLKTSKMMSFWWFSFLMFFIFLYFIYILGSAAWGFSLYIHRTFYSQQRLWSWWLSW